METLQEGLVREIGRVKELINRYQDPDLNGTGSISAAFMESDVKIAEEALSKGDVTMMAKALQELEGWEE